MKMEDNLNSYENGRRHKKILNRRYQFFGNERPQFFLKMEDNLIFYKSKTTKIFFIKDDLNPCQWKTNSKIKNRHSYLRQPDQHYNQNNIGARKNTKTKSNFIGCDIIVK